MDKPWSEMTLREKYGWADRFLTLDKTEILADDVEPEQAKAVARDLEAKGTPYKWERWDSGVWHSLGAYFGREAQKDGDIEAGSADGPARGRANAD